MKVSASRPKDSRVAQSLRVMQSLPFGGVNGIMLYVSLGLGLTVRVELSVVGLAASPVVAGCAAHAAKAKQSRTWRKATTRADSFQRLLLGWNRLAMPASRV